jgi:oxygen-independent coproporphyrinogen-3 oxidase
MGFGVDAHSMLIAVPELQSAGVEAVRFATSDSLEGYSLKQLPVAGCRLSVNHGISAERATRILQLQASRTLVDKQAAIEESFFLGLRLNNGVSLDELRGNFGDAAIDVYSPVIAELAEVDLLQQGGDRVRLTSRGRLLSNEVFERFLRAETAGRNSVLD